MQYLPKITENIFDVLIANNIPIDGSVKVLQDNNLSYDSIVGAVEMSIDESIIEIKIPSEVQAVDIVEPSPIKTLTIKNGQSIYDLALMAHGSLDNIVKLLQDNEFDSINDYLIPNTVINYNVNDVTNRVVQNWVETNSYVFNTSDPIIITGESFDDSFDDSFN